MSKNLFVLLLYTVLGGSVVAEQQEVAQQALVALEQAAVVKASEEKIACDGFVKITQDRRGELDEELYYKSNVLELGFQILNIDVKNEKTVEITLTTNDGSVIVVISTEKPEFIAALRVVTQENQEKLVNVVIEQLIEFLSDETTDCTDEFYASYEQKIALGIQEILSSIVFELEGAQALVKLYQNLAEHICVVIDQEIDAVSPEMSPAQAAWEIGANICNKVIKFFKNNDLESRKIVNHPLSMIPLAVRFAAMNVLNQEQQNFMMSSMQIQDIKVAGQALKDFYANLPMLVFNILKDFYPTLDTAILK